MTKKNIEKLNDLLNELLTISPCRGKSCVGHMNCEFGENGCYGESCAIEDVISGLSVIQVDES